MINKKVLYGLLTYLFFTYFLQLIAYNIGFYNGVWKTGNEFEWLVIDLIFLIIIFLALDLVKLHHVFLKTLKRLKFLTIIITYRRQIIYLTSIVGSLFLFTNLGNYRYDGVAVSEKLTITLALSIILKQFIYLFTFLHFHFKIARKKKFLENNEQFLIVFCQIITLTGVTSAIMLAITLMIFFIQLNRISVIKTLIIVGISPLIFLTGLYVKWSPESLDDFIIGVRKIELRPYLLYLTSRLSITYYSHMFLLDINHNIYNAAQNIQIILESFMFRLNIILQSVSNIERPDIVSINQLNYQQLANFTTNRTSGTSPGILPSFMYIFGNFWGLIFSAFYLNIILNLQLKNASRVISYTLISIVMFQSMYKSPMQILLIIDANFIGFICFLSGIIFINKKDFNYDNKWNNH